MKYEPSQEKTNNFCFRTDPTQTVLYKHRRWLEARNFGFKKERNCTSCVAKTKALISFAVTAKLICVFVFTYAKCWFSHLNLSRLMGKPTICIGENKDADQLRGNREADQRLCFRYSDSTIPLLLKSEISSI